MGEWRDLVQSNMCGLPRGPALVPFSHDLLELLPSLNDVSEFLLQLLGLDGYRFVSIRAILLYLMSLELV
jgi:hypothetical protein